MDKLKIWLRKFVKNPWLDLSVGAILVISSMFEVWETFPQDFTTANLRSEHAIIIFGFVMVLKALTDLFAGLEFMDEANQIEKDKVEIEKLKN